MEDINVYSMDKSIPEQIFYNGVEYIRKPERQHVWSWGQWARVDDDVYHYGGKVVLVVGEKDHNGHVAFVCKNMFEGETDSINPQWLTYISDVTIPE